MSQRFPEELPEWLRYFPFPIPDPGPPWLRQILDKETLAKVAVVSLQLEKDILSARAAAIDRQLQILSRKAG
jgi:hypothetical protein